MSRMIVMMILPTMTNSMGLALPQNYPQAGIVFPFLESFSNSPSIFLPL